MGSNTIEKYNQVATESKTRHNPCWSDPISWRLLLRSLSILQQPEKSMFPCLFPASRRAAPWEPLSQLPPPLPPPPTRPASQPPTQPTHNQILYLPTSQLNTYPVTFPQIDSYSCILALSSIIKVPEKMSRWKVTMP